MISARRIRICPQRRCDAYEELDVDRWGKLYVRFFRACSCPAKPAGESEPPAGPNGLTNECQDCGEPCRRMRCTACYTARERARVAKLGRRKPEDSKFCLEPECEVQIAGQAHRCPAHARKRRVTLENARRHAVLATHWSKVATGEAAA